MCVLNLSRLRSGVSFTLTQCSGSSPSPIAGQARDYRSEDIHEFSLFEIINGAHLKFMPNLVPRPRPAFRRLQYGKAGEGLVSFLT